MAIWLAEGCLNLLPKQNLLSASFALAKYARQYVLSGGMILPIQRYFIF